jgi:hypothetical protein
MADFYRHERLQQRRKARSACPITSPEGPGREDAGKEIGMYFSFASIEIDFSVLVFFQIDALRSRLRRSFDLLPSSSNFIHLLMDK